MISVTVFKAKILLILRDNFETVRDSMSVLRTNRKWHTQHARPSQQQLSSC